MPLPSFLREASHEVTPYLSPKCAEVTAQPGWGVPSCLRLPGILPATLEANAGAGGGPQEIRPGGRLSSLPLELVPQPRNELAERNGAGRRWCWLVEQALTVCVP